MPTNKEIEKRTVIDTPAVADREAPRAHPIILSVAAQSQAVTPWGVNPRARDRELRSFWVGESWLASVVYLVTIRNASFAWEIRGSDPTKVAPKNTINKITNILKQSNRGKGWQSLIIKTCIDLYCLDANTRIALGGNRVGKTKTIRNIVKDKDIGPVISIDNNGHITEQYINEWQTTPLGSRKWYWLSSEYASGHSRNKRGGIFITEDHPMLTDKGWIQAKDITTKDKIATKDAVPSEQQKEVLVGGLLGDMSISKTPKRAMLRFSHCIQQEEYFEFKKSLLKGFNWTGQNYCTKEHGTTVGVNSTASLGLNSLRNDWYPEGKKKLNRVDFDTYFSPIMMSIWFMDDGSKQKSKTTTGNISEHGVLCTDNFSSEDVEWMVEYLNNKDFACKSYLIRNKYYRIRFSADGYRKLSEYVGKYIIPSMRYKIGKDAPEYDPSIWDITSAGIFYDDIAVIEQRDNINAGTGKIVQTTFHIGVENTHNFVAGNLISHNTQDNAAFWEIIRSGNKPTDPVINIAHLDSAQCQRTGDPVYPVIYTNRLGKEIPLPYWRVQTLEEFPSPYETAFDQQYCAVTRALLAAEIIESISVYKQEKVGGHFTRAIDIVTGVTQNDIDDAVAVLKEQILNRGLYRYSVPLMIPGIDPSNALSHVHIDLASLPDNFDEDTSFKWYVAQLAAAFGVDYQEIAPLMTGNLGSSQQSEIMHLKTRGKGPAVIMALFENIINNGLIPSNVEFRFKEQDLRAETEKANARFTRGKDRAFRLKAGEIDTKAARLLAVEDGDLPEWMAKEIDERGETLPVNNEVGANQLEGGIESQVTKMTLAGVKELRKKFSVDPYGFLKSSFGNPSGTVIAQVYSNEKLLEVQSKMIELYRQSNSRFTPEEQFHITLVYSPLADDMEFRNIKRKIQSRVESMLPIRLQVSEITTFDSENAKALVLLTGDGAEELQKIVYDEFSRAGLPLSEYSLPENWKPHVTLGYVPYPFTERIEPFDVTIHSVAFTRSDYREEEIIWRNSDVPVSLSR